jgi:hypothetical protein
MWRAGFFIITISKVVIISGGFCGIEMKNAPAGGAFFTGQ